ncbi:unnamed protein product [Prunus armeniaca]
MLKAVMYPSLSIPFCFGQPAKRSYPEVMTTDMGVDNFAMKTCMVVIPCFLSTNRNKFIFVFSTFISVIFNCNEKFSQYFACRMRHVY